MREVVPSGRTFVCHDQELAPQPPHLHRRRRASPQKEAPATPTTAAMAQSPEAGTAAEAEKRRRKLLPRKIRLSKSTKARHTRIVTTRDFLPPRCSAIPPHRYVAFLKVGAKRSDESAGKHAVQFRPCRPKQDTTRISDAQRTHMKPAERDARWGHLLSAVPLPGPVWPPYSTVPEEKPIDDSGCLHRRYLVPICSQFSL